MKNFELLPTEENLIQALNDDIFQRNKYIVHFYNLLQSLEGPNSIAIDGRRGSGKTFFVKQSMLFINAKNPMCDMEKEKKDRILNSLSLDGVQDENYNLAIYYDAWENDNDTDPIMSIIYEITKQLSLTYDFKQENSIFKVASSIIEAISGRNVNGIIDTLKCEDPLEKFKEQKSVEDKLKQFFTDILIEHGNRLVVFIDELDRCKPSYAVHLLEQIKHYLCDDRITFVFSINLNDLQHTIKHYYGDSYDACRYLDKFFNLRIMLPPADFSKLYNKIGLNSRFIIDKICQYTINYFNLEPRETLRYINQVISSAFKPTHDNNVWRFSFSDGKAKL